MAVVWAKSNGNWATASIWAFWNEATQQIEDYGQIPQADDVVYLNGKPIQINVATYTYIEVAEIHNDLNPYTTQLGGFLDIMNSIDNIQQITFVCDWYGSGRDYQHMLLRDGIDADYTRRNTNLVLNGNFYNTYFHNDFRAETTFIVNGNIYGAVFYMRMNTSANKLLTINGNADAIYFAVSNNGTSTLTINGNVTGIGTQLIGGSGTRVCRINGNVYLSEGNYFSHSIYVNGIFDMSELSTNENLPMPFASGYGLLKQTDLTIIAPHLTDYPAPTNVKKDVTYAFGQMVGTYQQPPESVVLKGYVYDNGDKIGSLENQNIVGCVTKEDVREGVELIGLQEVGTLVVPSVDDVREGVVFDNGSVGTLIVEGGGDRLRIANFGYYTDSQSDTYIVDLNESFKQMFATAEESVLLELFPELDLDNIPDKYFDDLFVKYLKYRLIVEYYRGAGINSVFTPSELTTEVVNYQNVRCEYWLNLANIYLNAWDKKYPNSIKKQRILL